MRRLIIEHMENDRRALIQAGGSREEVDSLTREIAIQRAARRSRAQN